MSFVPKSGISENNNSQYYSLKLYLGKREFERLRSYLQSMADGWMSDIVPYATYREIGKWMPCRDASGGLKAVPLWLMNRIRKLYEGVATPEMYPDNPDWDGNDFGIIKHYESKYLQPRKMYPRNVRLHEEVLKKFSDTEWRWEHAVPSTITKDDVIETLEELGFKCARSDFVMRGINPPRYTASLGIMKTDEGRWLHGAKGDYWGFAMARAKWHLERAINLGRTWNTLTEKDAQQIGENSDWLYIPAWRLDGGPWKLRRLLIGDAAMYILEEWWWHEVHAQLITHPNFGYQPSNVCAYFQNGLDRGYKYLTSDLKRFDESQQPSLLRACYQGVQEFFKLNEAIGTYLYCYNSYAPTIGLVDGRMCIIRRRGQAASGIGGFPNANSIIRAVVSRKTAQRVEVTRKWTPGIYMGDDGAQPTQAGVSDWLAVMEQVSGLRQDPIDTRLDNRFAVFLRRRFQRNKGYIGPIIASRIRNMVFPELSGPWTIDPLMRALSLRGQGADLFPCSHVPKKVKEAILELIPETMWRFDLTDKQLQQQVNNVFDVADIDLKLSTAAEWLKNNGDG